MNLLGTNSICGGRALAAALVCLAGLLTPAPAFAQPGRTFTPPPPPPPPPPRIPTFTPPRIINHQQNMQHFQQSAARQVDQMRMNNLRDQNQTRFDMDRVHRAANPNSGSATPAGGAARNRANFVNIGNLAKVEIIVTGVERNSQCFDLGFMKGDILVTYAGAPLKGIEHLRDLTKLQRGNGLQALTVIRDGQLLRFDVAPGPLGLKMRVLKNRVG